MQEYVTPFWLFLLCIVAIFIVFSFYRMVTTIPVHKNGWTSITPTTSHWLIFFSCAAFYGLLTWQWIFVGSCGCDAEAQNRISYWMAHGFGIAAIYSGHSIIGTNRHAFRLRGRKVAFLNHAGKLLCLKTEDFRGCNRLWYGDIQLKFVDGTILQIDGAAKNADVVVQRLFERSWINPLTQQPDPAQSRSGPFAGVASIAQPSISAAPARNSGQHRR